MRSRCPWKGHVLLIAATGLSLCTQAWGSLVSYTVDPTQSTLTLSGSWGGSTLWHKPVGSLETSYSGVIQADLTSDSVQIMSATLDADAGGRYRPRFEGRGGRQAGDYGGFFRTGAYGMRGNVNVALRDVALNLAGGSVAISDGAFDAGVLSVSAASGVVDYSGAGLLRSAVGQGRSDVIGENLGNAASTDGSLVSTAQSETITIPIQITLASLIDSSLPDQYDRFEWTLSGSIVATRTLTSGTPDSGRPDPDNGGGSNPPPPDVPEPTTLSFLALGVAFLCKRRG